MVATRIGATTLCDYVHLRVSGTNPTQADVFAHLYDALAAHDANVIHMGARSDRTRQPRTRHG
jgi:hypothetical protein